MFELDIHDFSPGTYSTTITINAGEAGIQEIIVNLMLVEKLYTSYIPLINQ
jgi:hypothetical protein